MNILRTNKNSPSYLDLQSIVETLGQGNIVVLPTETVYTFAVDATDKEAIKKIYQIKGRDFNKPLHVVVSSLEMANRYVYLNKQAKRLADKFLPGPLSIVLKKRAGNLPTTLTSGLTTLGIRIPDLKINNLISEKFDKPYTTTSANISGNYNPYTIQDVTKQLNENKLSMIDLIVDVGPLPHLKPSTFVDLTQSPPKILREGPVTRRQLEKVLGTTMFS